MGRGQLDREAVIGGEIVAGIGADFEPAGGSGAEGESGRGFAGSWKSEEIGIDERTADAGGERDLARGRAVIADNDSGVPTRGIIEAAPDEDAGEGGVEGLVENREPAKVGGRVQVGTVQGAGRSGVDDFTGAIAGQALDLPGEVEGGLEVEGSGGGPEGGEGGAGFLAILFEAGGGRGQGGGFDEHDAILAGEGLEPGQGEASCFVQESAVGGASGGPCGVIDDENVIETSAAAGAPAGLSQGEQEAGQGNQLHEERPGLIDSPATPLFKVLLSRLPESQGRNDDAAAHAGEQVEGEGRAAQDGEQRREFDPREVKQKHEGVRRSLWRVPWTRRRGPGR